MCGKIYFVSSLMFLYLQEYHVVVIRGYCSLVTWQFKGDLATLMALQYSLNIQ